MLQSNSLPGREDDRSIAFRYEEDVPGIASLGYQYLHDKWRFVNSFNFRAHNSALNAAEPFPTLGTPGQYWDAVESTLHSEVEFMRVHCMEESSCFVPALPRGRHHYCCDIIGAVKLLEQAKWKGFDTDPKFLDELQKVQHMYDTFFLWSDWGERRPWMSEKCTKQSEIDHEQYRISQRLAQLRGREHNEIAFPRQLEQFLEPYDDAVKFAMRALPPALVYAIMGRGSLRAADVPVALIRRQAYEHEPDRTALQRLYATCRNGQLAAEYEGYTKEELLQEMASRGIAQCGRGLDRSQGNRKRLRDSDEAWATHGAVHSLGYSHSIKSYPLSDCDEIVRVYAEGSYAEGSSVDPDHFKSWAYLKWQIARLYFGIAPRDAPLKRMRQKTRLWKSLPADELLLPSDGQLLDLLAGKPPQESERQDRNDWVPNSRDRMQALGELAGRSGQILSEEQVELYCC